MAKLGEIFDSIPSWVKLLVVGGLFLQMYAVMYWSKFCSSTFFVESDKASHAYCTDWVLTPASPYYMIH